MVYLVTTTQKIDYPVPKHCERLLLSAFPSDIVSLKGKPKTGFDLLQTLQEVWEIMTS